MIKIAPIIHSRTYKCDFNPNIIVHPENLNIEWARNKIVSATSSINNMEHGTVRWVIARESNKSIAGIVCYIKDLIKFCNKEEKTISKLCYDNKGRSIFAFIGISFQSYEEKVNLNFDYEYFLDIYIKYMLNIWENENPISIISTYNDYSGKIFDNDFDDINFQKQKKKIGTLECYKMGIETDKKLFDYYLSKLFTNDELTFCSNLDIKKIREGNFDIVSTNENTIIRLENAEKNNLNLEENYFNNTNIDNLEGKKEISTVEKKKKFSDKYLSIFVFIIVILILILINIK